MFASEGLQRLRARASQEAPKRKIQKSRTTRLVMWAIVAYVVFLFGSQEYKILQVKAEKARIQEQIQIHKARNQLLNEQMKYLSSSEYIEKAAREQLGYIKKGEVPYITKPKPDANASQKAP